ncbi:hypothetical protein ACFLTX_00125 [Chloroflexota bacterium]
MKRLVSFSSLLVIMILSSCISIGGPIASTKVVFEQWTQWTKTPYKDVAYEVLNDDGTYATVLITVDLRPTVENKWTPMESKVECRKVGNEWSCDQDISFSLGRSLIASTQTVQSNRSTAMENKFRAEGTRNAFLSTATRSAQITIMTYINSGKVENVEYGIRLTNFNGTPKQKFDDCQMTFSIMNQDSKTHSVWLTIHTRHKVNYKGLIYDFNGYHPNDDYEDYFSWRGELIPGRNTIILSDMDFTICNTNVHLPLGSEPVFVGALIKVFEVDGFRR